MVAGDGRPSPIGRSLSHHWLLVSHTYRSHGSADRGEPRGEMGRCLAAVRPRLPPYSGRVPTSPHPGLRPQDCQYRRALLALFATGIAAFAMVYVVQPLLPLVSAEFDVNATQSSLLVSVSTFAIAVA